MKTEEEKKAEAEAKRKAHAEKIKKYNRQNSKGCGC
jgi:hypothetical protein